MAVTPAPAPRSAPKAETRPRSLAFRATAPARPPGPANSTPPRSWGGGVPPPNPPPQRLRVVAPAPTSHAPPGAAEAAQRLLSGRLSGQAVDSGAAALSETLTAFGADLARLQRAAPPIGLVQVARYANPRNSSATILLAVLLDAQRRTDEALA